VSRWARASREKLEALATATDASRCLLSSDTEAAMAALRASCPPLRTEAEVAAEALKILRDYAIPETDFVTRRLRALTKEPTRD
jgi:hypothetical protein